VPNQSASVASWEAECQSRARKRQTARWERASAASREAECQIRARASREAECQIRARRRRHGRRSAKSVRGGGGTALPNGNSNKKGTVIDAHVPEPADGSERSLKHAHGVVPGRLHRFSPVGLRRRRRSRWRSARAERGCRCRRWRPSREGVAVQTVVASREGMEGTEEAHGPVGSIVGGLNRAVLTKPCLFS
jgi:hypothetical protein